MTSTLSPRPYTDADAEQLTALLHSAYAELAGMGLNFTAVNQSIETTRERVASGRCWVIESKGTVAASITMAYPPTADIRGLTPEARVDGRAWIGQVAVDPSLRGNNVARLLFDHACAWAVEQGATSVGLDTALPAAHLRRMYERWGFAPVDVVHFEGKTYDSSVMVVDIARAD